MTAAVAEALQTPEMMRSVEFAARQAPPFLRDDARQEALLQVIIAARRFDPARGILFRTFAAQRATGAVADFLREQDPLTRLHRKQIKAGLVPEIYFRPIDNTVRRLTKNDPTPEGLSMFAESATWLELLTEREAQILRLEFWSDMTQVEIAEAVGLSPGRVCQVRKVAVEKIRAALNITAAAA